MSSLSLIVFDLNGPFERYRFNQFAQHCTDWHAGAVVTSFLNHVPNRIARRVDIGGTEYTVCKRSKTGRSAKPGWPARRLITALRSLWRMLLKRYLSRRPSVSTTDSFQLERILTSPQALIGGN
jgi:hypothetical protein